MVANERSPIREEEAQSADPAEEIAEHSGDVLWQALGERLAGLCGNLDGCRADFDSAGFVAGAGPFADGLLAC